MVDFNNETTVGTPAADVQRILILQRRNDLIEAMEAYHKVASSSSAGYAIDTHIIHARAMSLFYELQALLQRSLPRERYVFLLGLLYGPRKGKIESLELSFFLMNDFLDSKRIIRIDTKKPYDSTRVFQEDEANEL